MLRRFMKHQASVATTCRLMNWYPPLLGSGISARARDEYTIDVTMRLTWYNRNVVGTQFGGALYAMCDPWLMLLLLRHLGGGYVVWDKAATVRFKRPGRSAVRARFHISPDEVARIRARADAEPKYEPQFTVQVTADDGSVVAEVEKLLHVRRREAKAA